MILHLSKVRRCIKDDSYPLINGIISTYGNKIKTYIVEEYIESEWLDIYVAYYAKDRNNLSNKTLRVHFISEDIDNVSKIKEVNYCGYLTLRPICDRALALSRIRLKYDLDYYGTPNLYVINHKTVVSFPHLQIKYTSFPFFRQDGMVTVCAHADMHMLIKTMHNVHQFNYFGIANILNKLNSNTGRDIPNEGLSIYDILSALKERGFNPMLSKFEKARYMEHESHSYSIFDFIDSMIESVLPVILAYDGHVIILAGASRHVNGELDKYLVYDDSGHHLSTMVNEEGLEDNSPYHTRLILKESIENILCKCDDCFVIVPTFKNLYYRYKYVSFHLSKFMEKMLDGAEDIASRIVLVEANRLKLHLHSIGINKYDHILLPKHVWFIEIYDIEGVKSIMLIDATAHQHSKLFPIIQAGDNSKMCNVNSADKLILLEEIK